MEIVVEYGIAILFYIAVAITFLALLNDIFNT